MGVYNWVTVKEQNQLIWTKRYLKACMCASEWLSLQEEQQYKVCSAFHLLPAAQLPKLFCLNAGLKKERQISSSFLEAALFFMSKKKEKKKKRA